MSNEELKHIFENSTCLTKKQMVSYVSGNMTIEEARAVETHLNSCALCSDAVDGMQEQQEKALNTINADFLQHHLASTGKSINLTATTSGQQVGVKKKNTQNLLRTVSLAAGLLLLVVSIWYTRMLQEDSIKSPIAQELPPQTEMKAAHEPQPIAMNEVAKESNNESQQATAPARKIEATKALTANDVTANAPAVASVEKNDKKATLDEVAPLIGADERKMTTSEEIEKMPTRSTNNIASTNAGVYQNKTAASPAHPQTSFGNSYNQNKNESLSLGGAKDEGTAYNVDGVKTLGKRAATTQKESIEDKLEQADKLYEAKQYNDALNIYLREVNHTTDNDRKDEARIGAARCYIAVGDKKRAKTLLMAVSAKHGKHKREAKRLLKELD
jgi:hypothetical protein